MKFKAKSKDYYLYVKAKASIGEKIDEKELDRFARLGLRGFMKPKLVKKSCAEYVGPIGQNLYERLKMPISKREFLFILEHITVALQKAHLNQLSLKGLVLDIQNVYINKITKEVQFIYLPLCNDKKGNDVLSFVEAVIYSISPEDNATSECISKFAYYIKSMQFFDTEKIEKFILKEDRSVVNTIKKQNAGQSGYMTDKPLHYHEHYDEQGAGDEDLATELLEDEATSLLEEDEATCLLDEDEATSLLEEDEATALLCEEVDSVHYASIHRISTDERISINKPVFRIGKENSYVDYFVSNNINVSRSHADIVTRGGRYFVTDLNSKNHTYINERVLSPNCEVEIHDGDRLRLANEDFVFYE